MEVKLESCAAGSVITYRNRNYLIINRHHEDRNWPGFIPCVDMVEYKVVYFHPRALVEGKKNESPY